MSSSIRSCRKTSDLRTNKAEGCGAFERNIVYFWIKLPYVLCGSCVENIVVLEYELQRAPPITTALTSTCSTRTSSVMRPLMISSKYPKRMLQNDYRACYNSIMPGQDKTIVASIQASNHKPSRHYVPFTTLLLNVERWVDCTN